MQCPNCHSNNFVLSKSNSFEGYGYCQNCGHEDYVSLDPGKKYDDDDYYFDEDDFDEEES